MALGDYLAPKDYALTFINQWNTLYKYKVEGVTLSTNVQRYYYVIQLLREWDSRIDDESEYDDTKTKVPVPVSMLYTLTGFDNQISCLPTKMTEIEVTNKDVDSIRYWGGVSIGDWTYDTESHYIVFNTDLLMEDLYEADVTYRTQYYEGKTGYGSYENCNTIVEYTHQDEISDPKYVTLNSNEVVNNGVNGWFADKQTWNEIQSVADFLAAEDSRLTDKAKQKIDNYSWVLRFCTTEYSFKNLVNSAPYPRAVRATKVSEVSILRLKFATNGTVYNYGVIDNYQTDNGVPDGETPGIDLSGLEDMLKSFLTVFLIVLVSLLIAFCPWVFILLWWLIKGIWWLITFPFKLIGKKVKKKKKGRKNE